MKKVFISSTCFELLDIRAELEVLLKENGLIPILSDSITSEFGIQTGTNSIETCLVNVRECDIFLIVLSQRYGSSLQKAGFEDVSATHLEYKEAVKLKKPIFMYVRDRLDSDFSTYRKTGKADGLNWVKEKDLRLFELIDEHSKLTNTETNNWKWTYRNSVELKKRINSDLKDEFKRVIVQSKLKDNKVPTFVIKSFRLYTHLNGDFKYGAEIEIINIGETAGLNAFASFAESRKDQNLNAISDSESTSLGLFLPGESRIIKLSFSLKEYPAVKHLNFSVSYGTVFGYHLADLTWLFFSIKEDKVNLKTQLSTYRGKIFHHDEAIRVYIDSDYI